MNVDVQQTILVVDDDASFLIFLEELLKKSGYKVLSASSGKEAIAIASEKLPDLILLDVMMPGMSGGMTAHHLSEDSRTRNIPIVFLTSIISEEQEMLVDNKDGTYQFLAKPIRAERLLAEMHKALAD
ncbi:MAG: response regulator [Granulosicoccaceae bacterium]|jgi:CheY-like chemotaxis protein